MKSRQQAQPEAATKPARDGYVLRLYLAGMRRSSQRALINVKRICESRLRGRYKLSVVDLYRDPAVASREQIIAAPTLVKSSPLPVKRLVGDLSNMDRVLRALELDRAAEVKGNGALPATWTPE